MNAIDVAFLDLYPYGLSECSLFFSINLSTKIIEEFFKILEN